MSYDIYVVKFQQTYANMDEVPADAKNLPLGEPANVRAAISAVFPETDWNDPAWGVWDSRLGGIEFSVGAEDPVNSLALHVRAGEAVMAGIVKLLRDNGWHGMDGESPEFIENRPDTGDGLRAWQAFREQVMK